MNEVDVEEVYRQTKEKNSMRAPVKKSRFWIWVVVVLVVLGLVGGGIWGYGHYKEAQKEAMYFKFLSLADKGEYMLIKCIDYCPYVEYYTEWGVGYGGDTPAGSGFRKMVNPECERKCKLLNFDPFYDEAYDLKPLGAAPTDIAEKYHGLMLPNMDCWTRALTGEGKDCINSETMPPVKELDDIFIIPQYQNVTFNITSLSCSEEGVEIEIDLIEGEVYGFNFAISNDGNEHYIKKTGDFKIGLNKIFISKSEYPDYYSDIERVSVGYLLAPNDDFPNGWTSPFMGTKYCE